MRQNSKQLLKSVILSQELTLNGLKHNFVLRKTNRYRRKYTTKSL